MNFPAGLLAALALAAAAADWVAVLRSDERGIHVFKPLTLVALLALALTLTPHSGGQRGFFAAALALGLAGDVLLMLSERWFLPGLVAFLAGHLLYVAGFLQVGRPGALTGGLVLLVFLPAAVLGRVVGSLARRQPLLALAVLLYGLALTTMATLAALTGSPLALAGGLLFLLSDGALAWNRFVRPLRGASLFVIVTYHAAQACLVLYLAL